MQFYGTNTKLFDFSGGGGTASYLDMIYIVPFLLLFLVFAYNHIFKSHFIFITSMTQF